MYFLNVSLLARAAASRANNLFFVFDMMSSEWRKKQPLEWRDYLNKEVKVAADGKHEYQGWVFTIDPVSGTIVLVNFLEDGKASVSAIMGHAIQGVEVVNEGDTSMAGRLTSLFMPTDNKSYSRVEVQQKKSSLKVWLEKNRIPVTEQGEQQETLCVAGVLTIDPPYRPEDCRSSNEIILSRVQNLIQGHHGSDGESSGTQ
ncbi:gem-associated protein 6 [Latimeria chalumnae]|uniref:Gem-associated protein 6 n=1 Tax=Latimeria chalumnae TaxID=7897 RepID=H3A3U0_LATCH|nr:PREDICTED: gem-associated protein 6 [Latimeria chalumnae]|eukprot:XP_006007834.1 PREDICTED: gem-associated protein 6 [Latimeria chalumnae]